MVAPSPAATLLLAAVRQAVARRPPGPAVAGALPVAGVTADALREAASYHRVQPLVRVALAADDAAADLRPAVEDSYWQALTTHLRAVKDLGAAAVALDSAAVPWVAFKGAVLAETVYPRPDLRLYSDIDVLVDPGALGVALEAMEGAGFELLDVNWDMIRRRMLGEVHLKGPAGVVVDLHWHMVNRPENRTGLRLGAATLLPRAVRAQVGGTSTPILDPVDTCIHLAVHACLGGGDRLLWLTDLALALRAVDSPAQLVQRARLLGAARQLALILSRTQAVHPSAGTAEALHLLVPSRPARRLLAAAHAASPVEAATSPHSLARFLARTTASSTSESGRSIARRIRRRVSQSAAPERAELGRPDNPDSVLFATGGAAGRAAFIAQVEQHGERS